MPFIDANGVSLNYALSGADGTPLSCCMSLAARCIPGMRLRRGLGSAFACCATTSAARASEKVRKEFSNDGLVEDFEAIAKGVGLDPPYYFVTVAAAATQALRFFEKHPDRVGALVLCNPAPGVDASRAAALDERAAFAAREGMRASLATTLALSYPPDLGDRVRLRGLSRTLSGERSGRTSALPFGPGAH